MDQDDKTFKLRYVGTRFNGARMPLDVLSDLPAFRDLLVAFAKEQWRNLNSDRQRLPKGFEKSLSFDLIGIEEGSAVPLMNWNRQTAQANLAGFADELEEIVGTSFNQLVTLIDNAANGSFPPSLSSEHVRALNKLGAGLHGDERIEFMNTRGSDGNVIYLDSIRRKRLITEVRETYQTRFDGLGKLCGHHLGEDNNDVYIIVETVEHGEISIPLERERLLQEFDGNLQADVQFDLQIELDNNDRLRAIVDVHDVNLIDAEIVGQLARCKERLIQISALEAGWDNGHGDAIQSAAVARAHQFLEKRPALCGAYKVYPTSEGGVLLEFERNGWDYSVEFKADGVEMYGIEVDGDGEMEPLAFAEMAEDFLAEFDMRIEDRRVGH